MGRKNVAFHRELPGFEEVERAKAQYGDNQWWNSSDARTRAYYQFHEPVMVIPLTEHVYDLRDLLGRLVWIYEVSDPAARHEMEQEVARAWAGHPYKYWERLAAEYRALGATPDHLPLWQAHLYLRAQGDPEHQDYVENETETHDC